MYRPDPVLFTLELTTLHTAPWPAERIPASVANPETVSRVRRSRGATRCWW